MTVFQHGRSLRLLQAAGSAQPTFMMRSLDKDAFLLVRKLMIAQSVLTQTIGGGQEIKQPLEAWMLCRSLRLTMCGSAWTMPRQPPSCSSEALSCNIASLHFRPLREHI